MERTKAPFQGTIWNPQQGNSFFSERTSPHWSRFHYTRLLFKILQTLSAQAICSKYFQADPSYREHGKLYPLYISSTKATSVHVHHGSFYFSRTEELQSCYTHSNSARAFPSILCLIQNWDREICVLPRYAFLPFLHWLPVTKKRQLS